MGKVLQGGTPLNHGRLYLNQRMAWERRHCLTSADGQEGRQGAGPWGIQQRGAFPSQEDRAVFLEMTFKLDLEDWVGGWGVEWAWGRTWPFAGHSMCPLPAQHRISQETSEASKPRAANEYQLEHLFPKCASSPSQGVMGHIWGVGLGHELMGKTPSEFWISSSP